MGKVVRSLLLLGCLIAASVEGMFDQETSAPERRICEILGERYGRMMWSGFRTPVTLKLARYPDITPPADEMLGTHMMNYLVSCETPASSFFPFIKDDISRFVATGGLWVFHWFISEMRFSGYHQQAMRIFARILTQVFSEDTVRIYEYLDTTDTLYPPIYGSYIWDWAGPSVLYPLQEVRPVGHQVETK
ncbi:MAG: hypothetical protein LBJ70_02755 [Holosporales bacterium]|jgi:hypothetical protein|nr:hypothetical protein [Holosporales bacterium]